MLSRHNEKFNVSQQKIRYAGTELCPRPFVKDIGMNQAYKGSEAIRDGLRRWEVRAYDNNFSLIDKDAALADYDFGQWEISLDCGQTWLKTFLDNIPTENSGFYLLTLARGFTEANLTVTYSVGDGTFTIDQTSGNPVEDSTAATFHASVSQARNRAQLLDSPGTPPGRIYLEGFFVDANSEPVEMPTALDLNRDWPATLQIANSSTLSGTFRTLAIAENPWSAVELRRGSRCQGYFTTTGSGR